MLSHMQPPCVGSFSTRRAGTCLHCCTYVAAQAVCQALSACLPLSKRTCAHSHAVTDPVCLLGLCPAERACALAHAVAHIVCPLCFRSVAAHAVCLLCFPLSGHMHARMQQHWQLQHTGTPCAVSISARRAGTLACITHAEAAHTVVCAPFVRRAGICSPLAHMP